MKYPNAISITPKQAEQMCKILGVDYDFSNKDHSEDKEAPFDFEGFRNYITNDFWTDVSVSPVKVYTLLDYCKKQGLVVGYLDKRSKHPIIYKEKEGI